MLALLASIFHCEELHLYLSELQNVSVQIKKYIRPNRVHNSCLAYACTVCIHISLRRRVNKLHLYLSKLLNVSVQIVKCICPNRVHNSCLANACTACIHISLCGGVEKLHLYLSKLQNVFVLIVKCICPNRVHNSCLANVSTLLASIFHCANVLTNYKLQYHPSVSVHNVFLFEVGMSALKMSWFSQKICEQMVDNFVDKSCLLSNYGAYNYVPCVIVYGRKKHSAK